MIEFQLTQEYLGQATTLAYLAPLFKECLNADTYAKGQGSTVAKIVDGSLDNQPLTGMAGVANIGTDRNWCGYTPSVSDQFSSPKTCPDEYLLWFHHLSWKYRMKSDFKI